MARFEGLDAPCPDCGAWCSASAGCASWDREDGTWCYPPICVAASTELDPRRAFQPMVAQDLRDLMISCSQAGPLMRLSLKFAPGVVEAIATPGTECELRLGNLWGIPFRLDPMVPPGAVEIYDGDRLVKRYDLVRAGRAR